MKGWCGSLSVQNSARCFDHVRSWFIMYAMYLAVVAVGFCAMYFVLSYALAHFFEWERPTFSLKTLYSISAILVTAGAILVLMHYIDDRELANRVEHTLGGGFLGFLVCYLVARDAAKKITHFQLLILGFLVVTTLGVGNEIIEFVAQEHFGIAFAKNLNDTWLDLVSNTLGVLIAALFFVPLFARRG